MLLHSWNKKNHIVPFNSIYRTEFYHIAFNTFHNLTPLEIHQCVIVEQLLYLNAETLGTGVNVDVNLKRPLKGGGGGTALNSCAGGQHIAAQVRGQRQQGQTLSTGYNDTHDSGNIAILSFNGHLISAIFLDLSSTPNTYHWSIH